MLRCYRVHVAATPYEIERAVVFLKNSPVNRHIAGRVYLPHKCVASQRVLSIGSGTKHSVSKTAVGPGGAGCVVDIPIPINVMKLRRPNLLIVGSGRGKNAGITHDWQTENAIDDILCPSDIYAAVCLHKIV